MLTLPLGILSVILVTVFSLDLKNIEVYLNLHSFIIVILGTGAVTLFAVPRKDLSITVSAIWDLFTKDKDEKDLKAILINLSKTKQLTGDSKDIPLVSFAVELWEQGVDKHSFQALLYEKFDEMNRITELPVSVLKNLAKYPPALGMTGTVMGMITLFANLNSDNKSSVGSALALAMTATFYGLLVANMIFLPLADRIQVKHLSVTKRNELIVNALLKINNNEPVTWIENMNIEQDYYEQAG